MVFRPIDLYVKLLILLRFFRFLRFFQNQKNVTFYVFCRVSYVFSNNATDRQKTDGPTTYDSNTALALGASRGNNTAPLSLCVFSLWHDFQSKDWGVHPAIANDKISGWWLETRGMPESMPPKPEIQCHISGTISTSKFHRHIPDFRPWRAR